MDESLLVNADVSPATAGDSSAVLHPAKENTVTRELRLQRERARGCCGLWSLLRRLGILDYVVLHAVWIVGLSVFGSIIMMVLEPSVSLINAFFTIVSCSCLTGFSTENMVLYKIETQILMLLVIALSGAVLLTVPTLFVRRHLLLRSLKEIEDEVDDAQLIKTASYTETRFRQAAKKHTRDVHGLRQRLLDVGLDPDDDEHLEVAAMSRLLWIVGLYIFLTIGGATVLVALYLQISRDCNNLFVAIADGGESKVNVWWFALFASVSAFSNCGFTPVSMETMKRDPFVLFTFALVMILGNTGFPIFMRLIVKLTTTRVFSKRSQVLGTYILEKSRTMFTHMFSSYHTKMLLLALSVMFVGESVLYLISERKNSEIEFLDPVEYAVTALFQAASTRTGGFEAVRARSMQPGTQFVVMILMYIAVYPLLFTIRRSDVRIKDVEEEEARAVSLGNHSSRSSVLNTDRHSGLSGMRSVESKQVPEHRLTFRGGSGNDLKDEGMARQELMHKFTAKLVRSESLGQVIVPANVQQESTTQKFIRIYGKSIFVRDITWVFLAITIILFIEGSRIQAYPQDYSVFYVFFEVVSAYGTVGQSLSETNSYNGWSKLVIIFIMLLGRHRGLPSKNDPAVVPEHYQSLRKLRAKKRDEFEDLVETDSFGSQQPQRKDSTTVQ